MVETPESVSRAYVPQAIEASTPESVRDFVAERNRLLELVYTDAPARETIEGQIETIPNATDERQAELLEAYRGPSAGAIERVGTEIVAEELTVGEFGEQFRSPLIPDGVGDGNAVVDVRIEFERREEDGTVSPQRLLVAPEDGQW